MKCRLSSRACFRSRLSQAVATALHRANVEVLRNRHTTITLNNQKLQLVGLDDAYTGHARRDEAYDGGHLNRLLLDPWRKTGIAAKAHDEIVQSHPGLAGE